MIKTKYDIYINDNVKPILLDIYERASQLIQFSANAIIDMYVISYDATTGKTYFVAPVVPFNDVIKCVVLNYTFKTSKYKPYNPEDFEIIINEDKNSYIDRMAKLCIDVMKKFNKCIFTIDVSDSNDIEAILIALDTARNNFKISQKAFDLVNWKCDIYGSIIPFIKYFRNLIDIEENENSSLMFYNLINRCDPFADIPDSILNGISIESLYGTIRRAEKPTETTNDTKKEEELKMIIPDTKVYNNTDYTKEEFNFKPGDLVIHKPTNNIFKIEDINVYDDETDNNNINPSIVLYYSIEFTVDKINPNKVFLHKGFQHIMSRERFMKEFINLNVKLGTE